LPGALADRCEASYLLKEFRMAGVVVEGYVCVYEASDGGTGNPVKTVWQFFVGG
jgi:hypothetical protein